LPSQHLAFRERRFALSVREKHPPSPPRSPLPPRTDRIQCLWMCPRGLRYYVPRGRRRWSGRGSVLNLNPMFRYETKPRVDGASQAYASLESSFRLVVAPRRKGTRFSGNPVEMKDSSINLAFCALLCVAARLRGARGPVLADSGDSRSSRGGASSCGGMRSSVVRRWSLRRASSPRTTSEFRRVSMAVSRRQSVLPTLRQLDQPRPL